MEHRFLDVTRCRGAPQKRPDGSLIIPVPLDPRIHVPLDETVKGEQPAVAPASCKTAENEARLAEAAERVRRAREARVKVQGILNRILDSSTARYTDRWVLVFKLRALSEPKYGYQDIKDTYGISIGAANRYFDIICHAFACICVMSAGGIPAPVTVAKILDQIPRCCPAKDRPDWEKRIRAYRLSRIEGLTLEAIAEAWSPETEETEQKMTETKAGTYATTVEVVVQTMMAEVDA